MTATIRMLAFALMAGLACQAGAAWPKVSSSVGAPGTWTDDYEGARAAGKKQQIPVLLAIVDTKLSMPTHIWNTNVLESAEWAEWLGTTKMHLVWWDHEKINRKKWEAVAMQFAEAGSLAIPQIVLLDPTGCKADQFCAVNRGDSRLADPDGFIERLDEFIGEWPGLQSGPGTIGFTSDAVTVRAGAPVASMTVRRLGGSADGRQVFRLETVALTNANAAVEGAHYTPVDTNLVWEAGDASERSIDLSLNGEGWSQPVDRAFSVRLTKDPSSTAKVGTTNLTVTVTSEFSVTNGWWATTTNDWLGVTNVLWVAGPLSNNVTATLTWTAPQPGLLAFAGWQLGDNTNATLSLDFPSVTPDVPTPGLDTNETISAVSVVALAAGEQVAWTAKGTNAMFFVEMLDWQPLPTPSQIRPGNGSSLLLKDVAATPSLLDLVWTNAVSGAWAYSVLFTGKTATALSPAITNAPGSSVGAAGWGLTNGVYYWCVDNVATGAFKTVVLARSPVWSFDVNERPVFNVSSMRVSFYLGVPSAFTVHADCSVPVTYKAPALPAGLKIDPATGVVSGTVKRKGTFTVTVTATAAQGKGEATLPMTIVVEPLSAYISGALQGVVQDAAGTVRGVFTLNVAASGIPSLKMELDGMRKTLRGKWLEISRVNALVANFSDRTFNVDLTVSGNVATGRTADGLNMEARNILAKDVAKPYAGYYTVLLYGVPTGTGDLNNVPGGYGYLTFTVTERTGSVKYGGKLADGTSVSGSAGLMQGGVFPVYKPLYSKRGEVAALVALSQGTTNAVAADSGAWLYPGKTKALTGDAFTVDLFGTGAEYVKKPVSLKWLDGMVLKTDGADAAGISATDKKVTVVNGNGVRLSVTASTGLFSGSFRDTTGKSRSFKGAVVPAERLGAGYWLSPDPSAAGYRLNRSRPVEIDIGGTP